MEGSTRAGVARVEKEVLWSVCYSLIQHGPAKSKLTLRNKCQNIKHDKRNMLHVCKYGIWGLLNPDTETLVPKSIDNALKTTKFLKVRGKCGCPNQSIRK